MKTQTSRDLVQSAAWSTPGPSPEEEKHVRGGKIGLRFCFCFCFFLGNSQSGSFHGPKSQISDPHASASTNGNRIDIHSVVLSSSFSRRAPLKSASETRHPARVLGVLLGFSVSDVNLSFLLSLRRRLSGRRLSEPHGFLRPSDNMRLKIKVSLRTAPSLWARRHSWCRRAAHSARSECTFRSEVAFRFLSLGWISLLLFILWFHSCKEGVVFFF